MKILFACIIFAQYLNEKKFPNKHLKETFDIKDRSPDLGALSLHLFPGPWERSKKEQKQSIWRPSASKMSLNSGRWAYMHTAKIAGGGRKFSHLRHKIFENTLKIGKKIGKIPKISAKIAVFRDLLPANF